MKLSELLKNEGLSLSFEVFPPKTDTAFESVKHATEEIAKLRPYFMSVTYGAGGGTDRYTLEIAKNIKERYGVPTLAHLTCVSSTRETVLSKIEAIKEAGIENVMALRGDLTPETAPGILWGSCSLFCFYIKPQRRLSYSLVSNKLHRFDD